MLESSLKGLVVRSSVCIAVVLVVVPIANCSAVVVPGTSM